jgi:hypothetical protein
VRIPGNEISEIVFVCCLRLLDIAIIGKVWASARMCWSGSQICSSTTDEEETEKPLQRAQTATKIVSDNGNVFSAVHYPYLRCRMAGGTGAQRAMRWMSMR